MEENSDGAIVLNIAKYLNNGGMDSMNRDVRNAENIDEIVIDLKNAVLGIVQVRHLMNTIGYFEIYAQRIYVINIPESLDGIPYRGVKCKKYLEENYLK